MKGAEMIKLALDKMFIPIFFLGLLLSVLLPFQNAEGAAKEITLLHTYSVTGHLFPCPS